MSKLRQFGLLLWKNFIIQRRKVLVTLLEIGIPCTLAIILVLIRQSVQATQYANATSWHEFSIDTIPNNLTREAWNQPWKISWTPSNPATEGIVKTVSERLKMEYEGYGFPTEKRMVDFLVSTNGTSKNVLGGLVFTSLDPANLMYTIRLPSLSRGSTKMSIFGSETWQTEQMFPSFATVGPRSKGQDSGGKPNYWQQGFLALQQAVDRALIQHLSPSFEQGSVKIKLERHPYPPYRDDAFVLVIQKQFTFLIMLSFVFIAQNAVKCVVHEKEKKLKESMKMMGLASYLHWGAWFFHFMVMCAITVFLITIFVSVQFGPEGKVINNTDPSIVFVYLLVYSMSTIAFAFAVSTLFKKANTGAAAGGILFFISYIPYSFIQPRYHSMSFGAKLACCLINNLGMSMGGTVIGMFEGTGAGVQWSTIHRGASVDDSMSMLTVLIMLLVDTALYMVFTVYVEAVFPGEYGVPQPWYFPFTRTYWCGLRPSLEVEVDAASDQYETLNVDDTPDEFFERYPVGVEPGIQIKNLRKVFKTGPRHLVAVKGMNLKFYKGQITALLGHNGAGKTTTMAMLTGFIPPTTGTAVVNGHDIREDIDGVRQSLGLCPQHDVLFDELTVLEHLRFFCRLKGLPSARIEEESEKMLKAVGLYEKRNVFSKGLSGGMKRKLSVAIALSADSKVVILDEPTSGMDPNARRQTWELLQKERADRTMVLTTHYMDEADLLGDRIAIMAEGVLKCYGTSLFLKKKYGAGYHMVIVKQPQCNVSDITSVVQGYVEAATVESNVGADLSYILPDESASQFEAMFTELEERKDQLGILSYGVSVTTMEEVFLRVASDDSYYAHGGRLLGVQDDRSSFRPVAHASPDPREDALIELAEASVGESADPELQQRLLAGTYQSDDGNSLTESQTDMPDCVTSLGQSGISTNHSQAVRPSSSDFNTGCRLYLDQLRALFHKRVLYSWRNRIVTLSQLVVPLVFTIAALAIIKTLPTPGNSPPLVLNITPYEGNNMVMATELNAGAAAEKYSGVYKGFFAEFPETVVEDINQLPVYKDDPNIDKYLIEKGIESVSRYGNRYLIGAKFETGIASDTDVDVTGYFQSQAYHTGAITLNAISNAVLRAATADGTASLSTVNHPLPRTRKEEADDELTEIMAGFTISFNVMFGMAFLSSSFILFLIKERATKSKHCQLVAGARPFVFWLATFLWDYLNYMIPCLCLFVVFAGFDVVAYTGNDRLGILLLVFILYGWAMLPFMYLSSFLFTIPSTGYVWMTMFNVFSGIATVLTVEILSIPKLNTEEISRTLEWIFLSVLPNFCFGKALETVYTNYQYLELCNTPDLVQLCQLAPIIPNFTFPCCKGHCAPNCFYYEENYMSWEQGGIGRMLAFMAVQGLAFCLILFALESDLVHRFRFWIMSRGSRMGAQVTPGEREEASLVAEDSDVAHERERIRTEDHDDPLVMNEVVKYYNHLLAVDRLSFGISHAECFGLLGVNGAGKTTTFKMLTGDEPMTSGEAVVCGYDVTKNSAKVRRCIGYCPQYDALVDHMTGRELLTMYARLRGIKAYMIPEVVNQLLFTLTLENHADKRSDFYSGGNKRKLSTALALVGEPYIVFLDEPSSGLDPVARRLLWDALSRYRARGKTLVLTSHSMEECAALCTRIGIMVNGQFRCLGSQQHLKNKFGEGYTLIARVVYTQNQEPNVKPLMDYIQKTFPNSELKDVHQNLLHYHVPAAAATWAGIFGSIERVKDKLGIEDYSISQTTLEQVFINFARAQIAPNAAKRSFCGRIFCGGCCGCCGQPKQE